MDRSAQMLALVLMVGLMFLIGIALSVIHSRIPADASQQRAGEQVPSLREVPPAPRRELLTSAP
jgi:hypothetical protein